MTTEKSEAAINVTIEKTIPETFIYVNTPNSVEPCLSVSAVRFYFPSASGGAPLSPSTVFPSDRVTP